MLVNILKNETYKKECYLISYGIQGFGVTPNKNMATDYYEEEIPLVKEYLDKKDIPYELSSTKKVVEEEPKTKNKKVR